MTRQLPDPIIRYALDDAGPRCPCEWYDIGEPTLRDGETVVLEHGDSCGRFVVCANEARAQSLAEEMTTDGWQGVGYEDDGGTWTVYAYARRPDAWGSR